jgi:hypothetical protein
MEKTPATLVTPGHEGLSTSAVRVLLVGRHEEDFFLAGVILGRSRAAQGAERDHMNSLQEPKDAPGRDNYDLVLFEDETEARPAWLACNPNKLNFSPAAYNELLAL